MAINPLAYTEKVVRSFLRYQLTTYPFADERLNAQMRKLLSLDETRATPLVKGPFVSLSRAFAAGASVGKLVDEGVLHAHLRHLAPFSTLFGHQEEAIREIQKGRTTLISTGTGSGKSECFLYPIISRCLELRDQKAPAGVCAVVVYPMNALAEDQLGRLRELLAGTGVPFGMYVGKTPEREADVTGMRLPPGASRADYVKELAAVRAAGSGASVHPAEEVCSREVMRTKGRQPRILLTNAKQLEILLTRQKDVELFDGVRLDFLVFDEAHTFSGAEGAEVACLVRRLRSFCGRSASQTVCVATSATIVDENDPDAARTFAARFFGVPKAAVATVRERYEEEVWASRRRVPRPSANPAAFLEQVRMAVDAVEPTEAIRQALDEHAGVKLGAGEWEEALHAELSRNELVYQASVLLEKPRALSDLVRELADKVGRPVSEEELIAWLTLGAAARRETRPLVRPVVHAFVRGVPGAVVTFEDGSSEPTLHLSAEDDSDERKLRLRVATCTTCGQHYFEHALGDFDFTGPAPGGGVASEGSRYWEPLDVEHKGVRLLLVDRLISSEEGEDGESEHERLAELHLCRTCGAAHARPVQRCHACGAAGEPLRLFAVRQKEERGGLLANCVCCGARGRMFAGKFREPARPVRAVNVSDVHVLAQDMVHHAERKRLLVFADNRQDAAFQAGWMRDHARRFRLRSLMTAELSKCPLSVGDLVHRLDGLMEADDALSGALLPEVWAIEPKETAGAAHREARKYLLRIYVLLELTVPLRQITGLEPWGRIKVIYTGLDEAAPFVQKWARLLRLPADELVGGVAAFLDQMRRRKILYDSSAGIFARIWAPGARELENGFLPPLPGVPVGVKLTRALSDDRNWVVQWYSPGHQTTASQVAGKWGVTSEESESFLRELWGWLTSPDVGLLAPVTLKGSKGSALPRCHGTYQVNGDRLLIAANTAGAYRCRTCRQETVRRTPHMKCLAWRCSGELEHVPEDPDNYDLQLLDGGYSLLRPREHTAMVPTTEREKLEQIFKGDSDAVNTLVCTQTLELGVDIGTLDAILMRNVPPLPANYWQRAGRAGRRHRMAVDLTYCRLVNHDRAYFAEPVKMLAGRIDPPSFNLSNELMVRKHVHATVLTALRDLSRSGGPLPAAEAEAAGNVLRYVLPTFVTEYFFDADGRVMDAPRDVRGFHELVVKHKLPVEKAVTAAFRQGWPESDAAVVAPEKLTAHVLGMAGELEAVVKRLHRRLKWALGQMDQLERLRHRQGALDDEQQAFYDRCRRYVRKIKGARGRTRNQAEGVDDVVTLGVLAAEGFLPGYGLDIGSVVGMAEVPKWVRGLDDFDLPRSPGVALREYVPGNLIYANGQRFVPRRYARQVGEEQTDTVRFEVSPDRQAVQEVFGAASGDAAASVITSIPVCDVTLVHQTRISDEEENRFQMAVAIYGRELVQHAGGVALKWGGRELLLRRGVRLQLVNVGSPFVIRSRGEFGYPVCRVCGQSVSPFSSDTQRQDFEAKHREWCGTAACNVGFHADLTVDALTLPGCPSREEAYSVLEALRFAATHVLDMDTEDLQILVVGRADRDDLDAHLYDPMPGGSGLLPQLCGRFDEIVATALKFAEDCPTKCESSCIDCFQTYRNAFYHEHLNRSLMAERLKQWGPKIEKSHDIPAKQPAARPTGDEQPVNAAERKLRSMLLAAGFPGGRWQQQVHLPQPLGSTTPDVTFDLPDEDTLKVYVYLDGLSKHIHGNAETQARDGQIRAELKAEGHSVITITAVDLDDQQAMLRHFRRLARLLIGSDAVQRVAADATTWFAKRQEDIPAPTAAPTVPAPKPGHALPFEWVEPTPADRFRTCLPVYDLKAAATAFSQGQAPDLLGWGRADTRRALTEAMFIAQVIGRSMEPKVPDGSWCLFTSDVAGSRYGRDLVVQLRDPADPETGGAYTLKRYGRPPQQAGDGRSLKGDIPLDPINPDCQSLRIPDGEEGVRVVAEVLEVLTARRRGPRG